MKKKLFLSLLGFVTLAVGVWAFVGRTKTQCALLVFGIEGRTQVRVTLKGEAVSLTHLVNGNQAGQRWQFPRLDDCKNVEIDDPDGKTRYIITRIGTYTFGQPEREQMDVNVDIKGSVGYRQYCDLEMRTNAQEAAVAHFHGPLTAGPPTINWKVPPKLALKMGDDPTDLPALVGTMRAEHGCWVVVRSQNGEKREFPQGVCPVVDIEFPPKVTGGPTIKRRYALDEVC